MLKNLLFTFFFIGVVHFFSCEAPEEFGNLDFFSLDEPAYDIEFNVEHKLNIFGDAPVLLQYGVNHAYHGENHIVVLSPHDSIICFNLATRKRIWAKYMRGFSWPTQTGEIINGKFIYANNRGSGISHYVMELSNGNILKESKIEKSDGEGLLGMKLKNEDLILYFFDDSDTRNHIVSLRSWNWVSETDKELFSTSIDETNPIQLDYTQLVIEENLGYVIYHYEVETKGRRTKLFKYDTNANELETMNIKGRNINWIYRHKFASAKGELFVYASKDSLYGYDTEAKKYVFIKTPVKGESIEHLRVEDRYLVVKYPEENHLISLNTGTTILKPQKYSLFLHPSKELYFDRPVGDLSTLAIRDLSSGQMLCEAEFGFAPLGISFFFYDENEEQLIYIVGRYIFLLNMPTEL